MARAPWPTVFPAGAAASPSASLAVGLGQMGEFGFVIGSALVTAGAMGSTVALLAAVVSASPVDHPGARGLPGGRGCGRGWVGTTSASRQTRGLHGRCGDRHRSRRIAMTLGPAFGAPAAERLNEPHDIHQGPAPMDAVVATTTTTTIMTTTTVTITRPRRARGPSPPPTSSPRASAAGSAGFAAQADGILSFGEVAEWLKAAVLKTAGRKPRGFESHPLRHPKSSALAQPEPGFPAARVRRPERRAYDAAGPRNPPSASGPSRRRRPRCGSVRRSTGRPTMMRTGTLLDR